jgi:hypothetical protein
MFRSIFTFRPAVTAIITLALVGAPATRLLAQAGQATLSGSITDPSGAIIPGAKVTLIQESSKVQRTATSSSSGAFNFVAIPPDTYDILVSADGFRPARQNGIAVHINDQLDLPKIPLSIASSDITVTVTTDTDNVTPTTSGEQSYTLTDKQIQNLNIESRSAIELLDLIPGASNTGNFTGSYNREQAGFGQNSSTYTVNGNRFDQVQIVSDGAPVTDLNTAGAAAVTPNVDMISEAKVETSAFSSVQPNGPIVFETQTKSGGSQYHGEAYMTARNSVFNSNDAYNKQLGLPRANSSFYYPGVNIGGPVMFPHSNFNKNRDKLFFFAAAEFTQQHVDLGAQAALVPTADMRKGLFTPAELGAIAGSTYRHYYQSNQPCTGNYYNSPSCQNGTLNPAAVDPGGLILLNAFPLPNADPSTNSAGNNLITDLVTSDPRNQENLKLDYSISERIHLSGRFNHENENVPAPYGPYNTVNFAKIPYPPTRSVATLRTRSTSTSSTPLPNRSPTSSPSPTPASTSASPSTTKRQSPAPASPTLTRTSTPAPTSCRTSASPPPPASTSPAAKLLLSTPSRTPPPSPTASPRSSAATSSASASTTSTPPTTTRPQATITAPLAPEPTSQEAPATSSPTSTSAASQATPRAARTSWRT